MLSVAPAANDPAVKVGQKKNEINDLVKTLADDDFARREWATEQLMQHDGFDEKALQKAFASVSHPEIRNRLIRVAKQQYFARMANGFVMAPEDRGALGIRLSPSNRSDPTQYVLYPADHPTLPNTALVIAQTIPGFPAHVQLRRGDLVVAVNGKPLNDALTDQDFIARLAPQRKGHVLELRIIRDGKSRDIGVAMGSYTQLINLTYSVQYASRRIGEEGLDMFDAYPPWQTYLKQMMQNKTPVKGEVPGDI